MTAPAPGVLRLRAGLVEPTPPPPGPPTRPVPRCDPHDAHRVRAAAHRAARLYPGPVGEFLRRELLAWGEFGHRFERGSLSARLVHHLMTTPIEETS